LRLKPGQAPPKNDDGERLHFFATRNWLVSPGFHYEIFFLSGEGNKIESNIMNEVFFEQFPKVTTLAQHECRMWSRKFLWKICAFLSPALGLAVGEAIEKAEGVSKFFTYFWRGWSWKCAWGCKMLSCCQFLI